MSEKIKKYIIRSAHEDFNEEFDPAKKVDTIPSLLTDLDAIITGIGVRGETSIIAAGSGIGKTVSSVNMAVRQTQAGYKVLYLSMEMRKIKILEKMQAILNNEEEYQWRLEYVLKNLDVKAFVQKKNRGTDVLTKELKGNLSILDKKYKVNEICEIVGEAAEDGFDIIYLDNYQVLTAGMKHEQIVQASEKIREAVRKTNLAFIHLSQVTMTKDGTAQIRNGQKLKDDASKVVILSQKSDGNKNLPKMLPKLFAWVDKNRYGRAFEEVAFPFDREKQLIGNYITTTPEQSSFPIDIYTQVISDELDLEELHATFGGESVLEDDGAFY